jgi:RNA polymerase sigma-70 factor (ECF subfamily)
MVINAAIKASNRNKRNISLDGEPLAETQDLLDHLEATSLRPEANAEQAELREQIQEALEHLPPTQRAIVVKRYFLGLSDRELAGELELAPGTIRWHLSTARRRLRGLLSFNK